MSPRRLRGVCDASNRCVANADCRTRTRSWLPFRSPAGRRDAWLSLAESGRRAAEVLTRYIITDMYTKAVQGMPVEEAVKWAQGELTKVYA